LLLDPSSEAMVAKRGSASSSKRHIDTAYENKGSCCSAGGGVGSAPRRVYDAAFKLMVVRHALSLPENNRHKPIARCYPGLTPVQVRKWIRNIAALESAVPTAKLVLRPDECSGGADQRGGLPDYGANREGIMRPEPAPAAAGELWCHLSRAPSQRAAPERPAAPEPRYFDSSPGYQPQRPSFTPAAPCNGLLEPQQSPVSQAHEARMAAAFGWQMGQNAPPQHYYHTQPMPSALFPQGPSLGALARLGAVPSLPLHPHMGSVAPSMSGMLSGGMPCRVLDNTLPSHLSLHAPMPHFGGAPAHDWGFFSPPHVGAAPAAAEPVRDQSEESVHKGKLNAALDLLNLCNGTRSVSDLSETTISSHVGSPLVF